MFLEYLIIFKFLIFALILGFVLFGISFLFVYQSPYLEKTSSYECGFNPWGDARSKFEVRFYLVAILFIIFDLEITFLVPWVVALPNITIFGFYSVIIFLFILTLDLFMSELKVL